MPTVPALRRRQTSRLFERLLSKLACKAVLFGFQQDYLAYMHERKSAALSDLEHGTDDHGPRHCSVAGEYRHTELPVSLGKVSQGLTRQPKVVQ